uniref:F-box protein At1g59680 n=1 Tax=Arabidopsis thaliana TaxID=3702 RepID=FB67_ARATH|nr:RecName: Full=F-box protein At1g59680 [Arabidopsis thaliana]
MTTMSDLSVDLVGEILSRVPLTSLSAVRCTCKSWNTLSKHQIFGKAELAATKQFLGFTVMDYKVCSLRFDLQGIRNDGDDFVDHGEVYDVFHSDGLLLCVTKDHWRLVVWNPYLGQIRWIRARKQFGYSNMFSLGYNNSNRNHKIIEVSYVYDKTACPQYSEIYDFNSSSWRLVEINPVWFLHSDRVSLKGNTYFFAQDLLKDAKIENYLLCFDFTAERFGPHLPLPVHSYDDVTLSCVRQEQLALLYGNNETDDSLEIWITNQIDPNAVSWSIFLKVDIKPLIGFPKDFDPGSFFIDEEKKVVVVYDLDGHLYSTKKNCAYQRLYIIGEDGYFTSVKIKCSDSPEFSAYAPSLVTYKPTNYAK